MSENNSEVVSKIVIETYTDGSTKFKSWYQDGKRHRLDGPAVINYDQDGSIESECWYQNGSFYFRLNTNA